MTSGTSGARGALLDLEGNGVDVRISEIGVSRLAELRDLWLALHRHHHAIGSWPLLDDEALSWDRRRAQYEAWLAAGEAFVLLAEREGRPVGYAVVRLHNGPDDTYPLGARYAEIYSLAVAPEQRGHGIGGALMDRIDAELHALGIRDVTVAAMVENDAALQWYMRRGFAPREIVLYRFGDAM
jgi:ribosomal protein S18 acetylase RimI-like enzyme